MPFPRVHQELYTSWYVAWFDTCLHRLHANINSPRPIETPPENNTQAGILLDTPITESRQLHYDPLHPRLMNHPTECIIVCDCHAFTTQRIKALFPAGRTIDDWETFCFWRFTDFRELPKSLIPLGLDVAGIFHQWFNWNIVLRAWTDQLFDWHGRSIYYVALLFYDLLSWPRMSGMIFARRKIWSLQTQDA